MTDPAWQSRPFIGLSATPWTPGLGRYFDDLIIAATTQTLISEGYLAPFRVFAPSHPDLTGVRTVAGDYHEGDLSGTMNNNLLVADIVDTWKQRGENRPTFCFAVDRAHAKNLQKKFTEAGVPTGYIDAYTPMVSATRPSNSSTAAIFAWCAMSDA
jgi:superfamily II DNA or RNA helicase